MLEKALIVLTLLFIYTIWKIWNKIFLLHLYVMLLSAVRFFLLGDLPMALRLRLRCCELTTTNIRIFHKKRGETD